MHVIIIRNLTIGISTMLMIFPDSGVVGEPNAPHPCQVSRNAFKGSFHSSNSDLWIAPDDHHHYQFSWSTRPIYPVHRCDCGSCGAGSWGLRCWLPRNSGAIPRENNLRKAATDFVERLQRPHLRYLFRISSDTLPWFIRPTLEIKLPLVFCSH